MHEFFIIINMEKYQEQYVNLSTKTCFTELWGPVSDNPHLHPGKGPLHTSLTHMYMIGTSVYPHYKGVNHYNYKIFRPGTHWHTL